MLFKTLSRLQVKRIKLCLHRVVSSSSTCVDKPVITVTPSLALVDEKLKIKLSGLKPHQMVTLVANAEVEKSEYESRAVYQASRTGEMDNTSDTCLGGTYLGKDSMGLFWSLKASKPNTRFVKKDVTSPFKVDIRVFDGVHEQGPLSGQPLMSTMVERLFMAPGTKRIHVETERVRGTVFIPPGKGPFPAVIDTYGGIVSLIETRAALLSAHGYVTLALSYMHNTGKPGTNSMLLDTKMDYIKGAADWFCEQEYVDENHLGLLGLCYGGFLFFQLATMMPQVKAVVNINGLSYCSYPDDATDEEINEILSKSPCPDSRNVYKTEEGIVIKDVMYCEKPYFVKAWKHGAKVLLISGGDDKQIISDFHWMCYESVPPEYKDNVQYIHYPGAGHLIEMPYIPYVRAVEPGRKRMLTVNFISEEFADDALMCGGFPVQHAFAQEDSWRRVKEFLKNNLKS